MNDEFLKAPGLFCDHLSWNDFSPLPAVPYYEPWQLEMIHASEKRGMFVLAAIQRRSWAKDSQEHSPTSEARIEDRSNCVSPA